MLFRSADGGGGPIAASTIPSSATGSDSSDYEDSESERGPPPPPAPVVRGKSPSHDVVDQADDGVREVIDLSSGFNPDSEGSSSVPATKQLSSARRTNCWRRLCGRFRRRPPSKS